MVEDACRGIDTHGSLVRAWQDLEQVGVQRINAAVLDASQPGWCARVAQVWEPRNHEGDEGPDRLHSAGQPRCLNPS